MAIKQNGKIYSIPDYNGCGIYAIINSRDMKCYIGASKRIKTRAMQHKTDLESGRHANKLLQEDFNRGAQLNFIIICRLDNDTLKADLIALEKLYMLTAMDECFEIYNLIPKTTWKNQREWINAHLIMYLMGKHKTREKFVGAFSSVFGTTPAYMKNRNPNNR